VCSFVKNRAYQRKNVRLPRMFYRFSLRMLLLAMSVAAVLVCFVGRPYRDYLINVEVKERIERLGGRVTREPIASGFVVWLNPDSAFRIVKVDLGNQRVNTDSLELLTELSELKAVYLYYSELTDASIKHLPNCPKLEVLDLDGTRITDAGLKDVGRIPRLKWLGLRETAISDDGLRHLHSLRHLEQVLLWNTSVSESGAQDLRTKLPGAVVSRVPLEE
jgi:hypothetical protein